MILCITTERQGQLEHSPMISKIYLRGGEHNLAVYLSRCCTHSGAKILAAALVTRSHSTPAFHYHRTPVLSHTSHPNSVDLVQSLARYKNPRPTHASSLSSTFSTFSVRTHPYLSSTLIHQQSSPVQTKRPTCFSNLNSNRKNAAKSC